MKISGIKAFGGLSLPNKKAVLEALSYFEKDLALLRQAVENDEIEVTRAIFARAAEARRRIAPHLPPKRK